MLVTEGNFELRKYSSYIVAETYMEGNLEAVANEGFRRLADYIGGKNRKKESISMTAADEFSAHPVFHDLTLYGNRITLVLMIAVELA